MKTRNLVKNKKNCCGCEACLNICPLNAINMKMDELGIFYPEIDEKKCVNCGKCVLTCAFNNQAKLENVKKAYAVASKQEFVSKRSSSAGVFFQLAKNVILEDGLVCGTAFDEKFYTKVIAVENELDLVKIQGSKYVQSSMNEIYKVIQRNLANGRKVLFGGTPCQVNALRHFFKDKYSNLLLVDLVCHGIPGTGLFNEYIKYISNKNNIKVKDYNFRDKTYGQDTRGSITFEKNGIEKKKSVKSFESSYYSLFLKGVLFRDSCYNCDFAQCKRVGDITLCDFWGIEEECNNIYSEMKKNNVDSISGVLVNTSKGFTEIEKIKNKIYCYEVPYNSIRKNNPQLNSHYKLPLNREKLVSIYKNNGYAGIDQYYFTTYRINIICKKITSSLPYGLVKFVYQIKNKTRRDGKNEKD